MKIVSEKWHQSVFHTKLSFDYRRDQI